ncbi:acetylxylan esterase [Pedobacter sp. N36a]|uniref:alpha/beta hydrolase family protein n=1 Tax=Pedobacter sp. N36a TaxID=2767996 RepID=UPI0016569E79|nr:acetylxylan esterase [Pedobacter sp. N36a]MBC8985124.1 acetylxylan esterase [Pedobacter sp. N36a]
MVKKALSTVALFFFAVAFSCAQKPFDVLDWKGEASLNAYLIGKMTAQYEARRNVLGAAKGSKDATVRYQAKVKAGIDAVIKGFPSESALNPKISGTIIQPGYRIEKVSYESFRDHHVTANLYLPTGKGPFPTVLMFCGHEDSGKATPSYQQAAILFAKNGFVVFVIDPISQSERHQLLDEAGKPQTKGGTTEHTLLNQSANLLGSSVAVYELFDNMRGLDYLCTRKEVDSSRIGCIGNSGGGMQVIYFAAMDARVKVLAPCSYLASRARTLAMTGPADGCAQVPGEGEAQLEMSDYLIAAAPKPLLVLAGEYDFIDYQGTLESYGDLKQVYLDLGVPDHLSMFSYADGHGLSKPKREAAVTWFRRHFYKDSTAVKEGDLEVLPAAKLFVSPNGLLQSVYPNERSLADYHLSVYHALALKRSAFSEEDRAVKSSKIKQLLALSTDELKLESFVLDSLLQNGLRFYKMILRSPGEIPLPFLLLKPTGQIKQVLIWAAEAGKESLARDPASLKQYLDQGFALVLPDLRGIGETKDKAGLNDPKYQNKEYRNAMFALHIGKPLAGQRVYDLLCLVQFIQSNPCFVNEAVSSGGAAIEEESFVAKKITIRSNGLLNVPAMHAAFLEPAIVQLDLYQGTPSYLSRLENPLQKDGYSELIPGVLAYYDLPDLIRWLSPIPVNFFK